MRGTNAPPADASAAQILERVSDAFISLDAEWRCTYLNGHAAQLLGQRAEDLIGRDHWTQFPGDVGQPFHQACLRSLAEQIPLQIEEYFAPTSRWFEDRIYPCADGLSIFFQDITERKQADEERRRSEESLRETLTLQQAILDSANYSIISTTEDGTITTFNAGATRMLGYQAGEVVETATIALLHEAAELSERARLLSERLGKRLPPGPEAVVATARRGEASETEWTYVRKDGTRFPVTLSVMALRSEGGDVTGFLAIGRDITTRRQAEAARQMAEENYRGLFENAAGGIFQTSPEGRYLKANPALARIYGYETPQELVAALTNVGRQLYVAPERRAEFERLMREQGFVSGYESQVRRRDGVVIWISESARPVWDASGALLRYEGFVEDVSDRKALEAEQARALRDAEERADLDPLTGLLNHRAFYKRLEEETARAGREGTTLAVVMLDLDNFKFFNDAHGHIVGDEVLRQVAARMRQVCRSYDTLARFGGDEFALLLPGAGQATREEIEARLRGKMSGLTHRLAQHDAAIPITVSLGAAILSDLTMDRQEAVRQADERLIRSKTGGAVENGAGQVRASALRRVQGFSMLDALVAAVDNKDRYTRRHSEDVMTYSLQIAREIGLGEPQLQTVAVAALLHDVGKIGTPDAILRKPGRLTGEEFEAVKQHPQMGAILVGAVPGLEDTLDAVRHHHERWDGGGYPSGLRGEETPLLARLMAVADAFSAMTTDRFYRQGMEPGKALALLEAGAGTQWDAECVRAFLRARTAHAVTVAAL